MSLITRVIPHLPSTVSVQMVTSPQTVHENSAWFISFCTWRIFNIHRSSLRNISYRSGVYCSNTTDSHWYQSFKLHNIVKKYEISWRQSKDYTESTVMVVLTSITAPLILQTTLGFSSDSEHSRMSSLFCLAVAVSGSFLMNWYSTFLATHTSRTSYSESDLVAMLQTLNAI